jgi:hypothetical protein
MTDNVTIRKVIFYSTETALLSDKTQVPAHDGVVAGMYHVLYGDGRQCFVTAEQVVEFDAL